MTKTTNATDAKLATLRAQVRALETGAYFPGVLDQIHAVYDEIAREASKWREP